MHPYTIIKNKISESLPSSWKLSDEDLNVNYFGSYLCVFTNGRNEIRWVWDGKEGWGFVQKYTNNAWHDLPVLLTEGDIEGATQDWQKIAALLDSVRETVLADA